MATAAVIVECNPMHTGHTALLARLRTMGFDKICLITSGNYVQRGEIALFDKWTRTKAMLAGGGDLVIEIPTPYCLTGAQAFARAGVALAGALGCVDTLAFGSECGDVYLLQQAAALLEEPSVRAKILAAQREGKSYPRAVCEAAASEPSGLPDDLFSPNNILGLEYLHAIDTLGLPLHAVTVPRTGSHDDAASICGMALRQKITGSDWQGAAPHLAVGTLAFLQDAPRFETKHAASGLLITLKRMEKADFATLPQVSEGLENNLYTAARKASTLEEFYGLVKSKRYPLARLRRIVMCAFLGIDRALIENPIPPYLRVLGMNDRGAQLLHHASPALPVSVSLKRLEETQTQAARMAQFEVRATDLAGVFTPIPLPPGREYTTKFIRG